VPLSPIERRAKLRDGGVYLVFTRNLCRGAPLDVLRAALRAGVAVVQVRERGAADGDFLAWARVARAETARCGVPLIVNDRADAALLCDADGLHVGRDDLPPKDARTLIGAERVLGLSTREPSQIDDAARDGDVDYVGFGPSFDTATKGLRGLGLGVVAAALARARAFDLPVFPIGGIDAASAAALAAEGARGVAVSSAICAAADPFAATAAIAAAFASGRV
jgi:thiamine-phosphate pyrophosphorylase